jgi:hypothetical protein
VLQRDVVAVVLERRCGNCHTGGLASAGLRIDDVPAMIARGIVVPGKDAESPLVQRMLLPDTDRERMPPITKAQPSAGEVEVIRTWIAGGASSKVSAEARTLPADVVPPAVVATSPAASGSGDSTEAWAAKTTAAPVASASAQPPASTAPRRGGCAACSATGAENREVRWLATLASAALSLAAVLRRKRR